MLWNGAMQYNLYQKKVRCPPSLRENEPALPLSFPCVATTTIIQFWTSARGIHPQWFQRKIRGAGWKLNALQDAIQECYEGLQEASGERALPYRTLARWVKAFHRHASAWLSCIKGKWCAHRECVSIYLRFCIFEVLGASTSQVIGARNEWW